mgnify:CR=1 FL=1
MKHILIIALFCLLVFGCTDKKIGIVSFSDKDGCIAMFKLKKDAQHICVIETCLINTRIKFPGNTPIIMSELFKEKYGTNTVKTPKTYLPPGWKLQFSGTNKWRVLKPSGHTLIFDGGRYKFESKQVAIDAAWEEAELENQHKRENTWNDYIKDPPSAVKGGKTP